MITRTEVYFADGCGRCARFATPDCSARFWAEGLAGLRHVLLQTGLTETAKWGHPCYMHAGRNVAIIGAFRSDFRLTFFHAALMRDPQAVLERQGPNTRHPDMIRFTASSQVTERSAVIRSYALEAMGHAEAGTLPPKAQTEPDLPDELVVALDSDPDYASAFYALTPGRRRGWIFHLASARTEATRTARVAKARDRILAGKGATER